ncbi:MAG: UvrD-helicase domain-containing protein [Candidatus Magasanikbacteria bacterium]|nr:UvrD-helicase domain-containing protein [Candidatus Magasanikbacteria bacterium]
MINFSQELNPEQLRVVTEGDGPCLVLAGAGSGKTRTITYRVAHLLEQGIKPEEILLVTFTNKAAAEMKRRVEQITALSSRAEPRDPSARSLHSLGRDDSVVLPWSGTFHSIGYRLLRMYGGLLGYKNNNALNRSGATGSGFTVLDSDDSESLIKLCIKDVKSDEAGKRFPSAAVVAAVISFSRNAEISIQEILAKRFEQWQAFESEILTISNLYIGKKMAANALDFDDLLTKTLALVKMPQIKQKYSEQFKYILVDEYQDTNRIQAALIKELSGVHNNVLVVGDDAQSIYSFRAADIENILGFEKEYPGAKIFKLETNYRSTKPILDVANSVIENNVDQYQKNLRVVIDPLLKRRGQGEVSPLPVLQPAVDSSGEAMFIANKIEDLLNKKTAAPEIAVLFRAAFHSQALEVELVSRGIDYDYRGGVRFFERAHVKDILCYLRIFNNLADTAAWLRVLTHEEGIGPAAAEKIIEAVRPLSVIPAEAGIQNVDTADSRLRGNDNVDQVESIGRSVLTGRALGGFENFLQIWNVMLGCRGAVSAPQGGATPPLRPRPNELVLAILKSPYQEYLESEYVDSKDRQQDLLQLAEFAKRFDNLEEFLASATLQESFRTIDTSPSPSFAKEGGRDSSPLSKGEGDPPESLREALRAGGGVSHRSRIILSTIHQAKGLEWEAVFVMNLSAGAFPNDRASREDKGLEEERRLFYVAVTRAKKYLYLTYPMAGGSFGDFLSGPSIFINEIKPGLVEDHSLLLKGSSVFNSGELTYVSEEDEPFSSKPIKIKPGSLLRNIEDL